MRGYGDGVCDEALFAMIKKTQMRSIILFSLFLSVKSLTCLKEHYRFKLPLIDSVLETILGLNRELFTANLLEPFQKTCDSDETTPLSEKLL